MKNFRKFILPIIFVTLLFLLTGCGTSRADWPIQGFSGFMDLFVWPMAGLFYILGKSIAFGNYESRASFLEWWSSSVCSSA